VRDPRKRAALALAMQTRSLPAAAHDGIVWHPWHIATGMELRACHRGRRSDGACCSRVDGVHGASR
ncbi:hypothetical protein, partial [Xanthomonas oryzae]|uniref:hypothetical protein n=2 Tax=Xanthomonas oryzae TaxID=347 RepID=UPI001C676D8F